MKIFTFSIRWMNEGFVEIEANNIEEAKEKLLKYGEDLPIYNNKYVKDSLTVGELYQEENN